MSGIKFGTSGWRGIIAEDFTFANARLVCQAIADYLKDEGMTQPGVVIGYDTRFMSETFAATAAEVMAGNGIPSFFSIRDIPTPVVSIAILEGKRGGGINITASHNPPEWNGIKFTPSQGGPAPTPVTNAIESIINTLNLQDIKTMPLSAARDKGLITDLDPRAFYFQHLKTLVDTEVLGRSGLRVVVDALYGTGRDYLDTFLREAGVAVESLHCYRDPYFGGHRPEPSKQFLEELSTRIKVVGADLGLAVDADADRFGVMDSAGEYVETNDILPLLLDYLIKTRGWEGGVARTVATSHLVDRVAASYGRQVYETPVGFKYLGEYILKDLVIMAGEESEGFTMKNHTAEKDGILACLIVAEMVAREGKGIPQLLEEIYARVGRVYNRRINLRLDPDIRGRLFSRLQRPPAQFAGLSIVGHTTIDGHKYLLEDGSWVCFRPSGTEPVVRYYFEASTLETLERLGKAGEIFLQEISSQN